jgi:hypothetical protein
LLVVRVVDTDCSGSTGSGGGSPEPDEVPIVCQLAGGGSLLAPTTIDVRFRSAGGSHNHELDQEFHYNLLAHI